MTTKKKWTKEEENILSQAVKANPQNLCKAFKEAAEKLDRTEGAIKLRWYTKTKHNSICFITISQEKKIKNGKTYNPDSKHINSPTSSNKTLWVKLKALLGWK